MSRKKCGKRREIRPEHTEKRPKPAAKHAATRVRKRVAALRAICYNAERMADDTEQGVREVLLPMVRRYTAPYRGMIVCGIVAGMFAAAAAGFGLPVMIQHVFPVVFGVNPPPAWAQELLTTHFTPEQMPDAVLWGAVLLIPLLMCVRGIATYFNTYLLTRAGMQALSDMRRDAFARLQYLSFSFHDRHLRGELMTIVLQFTQRLESGMMTVLNDLVIQPLTLMAAVAYLVHEALTNHESAILLGNLLVSALVIPAVRLVGRRMVKHTRSALAGMNIITSTVEETLSAQREVRAFNLQGRQTEILHGHIRRYNGFLLRVAAWKQALGPSIEIVSALALAYSLYRGCSDGLTLEQFSAIATAFYFCYDPIKKLGDITNLAQTMAVAAKGLNTILLAADETPEPKTPVALPRPVKGAVSFRDVSFSYTPDKRVLADINVEVPAGQIVALVGPSGSGKTTFINLICRFYDPQQGSVSIDGVNVKELSRQERTDCIGLVSQFSALFRDSIRENIRLGRPAATDAEVEQAGARARVQEFAAETEEGYDRVLAEGGNGLSGGQRQRVSIARAFLKNAPILILDEATSALDMKSEEQIQSALDDLAAGHTTFIIAHRFSTIRKAERILVFEAGHIVGDGTHDSLYEGCPLYKALYDEQVQSTEGKEEPAC